MWVSVLRDVMLVLHVGRGVSAARCGDVSSVGCGVGVGADRRCYSVR